jgi:hypothetical protein
VSTFFTLSFLQSFFNRSRRGLKATNVVQLTDPPRHHCFFVFFIVSEMRWRLLIETTLTEILFGSVGNNVWPLLLELCDSILSLS